MALRGMFSPNESIKEKKLMEYNPTVIILQRKGTRASYSWEEVFRGPLLEAEKFARSLKGTTRMPAVGSPVDLNRGRLTYSGRLPEEVRGQILRKAPGGLRRST